MSTKEELKKENLNEEELNELEATEVSGGVANESDLESLQDRCQNQFYQCGCKKAAES